MNTVGDVIDRFGGSSQMGEAIGEAANLISQWRYRDRIPGRYWRRIIAAADALGFADITYEALAALAERQRQAA